MYIQFLFCVLKYAVKKWHCLSEKLQGENVYFIFSVIMEFRDKARNLFLFMQLKKTQINVKHSFLYISAKSQLVMHHTSLWSYFCFSFVF